MWSVIIPAAASLIGGALSGAGGQASANAQADAARDTLNLTREIYGDQRGLSRPGYLTGGAATNILASQFGISPQDYEAAFGGAYSGAGAGYNPANWGAGQPVAGHTGGGGPNPLFGGLVRKGGDNWQTLGTSAPQGYDYDAYMAQNPGLGAEWAKPDVQALFGGNRDAYAWWHYNNFGPSGKNEGWVLNPVGGNTQTPQPVGGAQVATEGSSSSKTPMQGFVDSPYGQIAVEGFRGVDVPEINSAFARGGKVLSGAQSIALDERGKARLGGAYNDYTNALRSLSGLQQTASSQIGGAANQYGANAGNAMMAAGQAKGNALESAYKGIGQGITGAFGAIGDYLKTPGKVAGDPAQAAYPGYY